MAALSSAELWELKQMMSMDYAVYDALLQRLRAQQAVLAAAVV